MLIHFPTSWTTSKMDDFGTIFGWRDFKYINTNLVGPRCRPVAWHLQRCRLARRDVRFETKKIVGGEETEEWWNGWGKILRSQVVWWLECNMIIWYMFRLFRWYSFVKHEISFYPKGQNSAVLSSLVWWRTHTQIFRTRTVRPGRTSAVSKSSIMSVSLYLISKGDDWREKERARNRDI